MQEVKAMTQDDLQRILNAAEHLRDRALIMFFASTGCRAGEAASLTFDNLNTINREAKIHGKTGTRFVDFNHETARVLNDWIRAHPNRKSGFVFVGVLAPHNPITPGTIYSIFRRLAIRAGVDGRFNPHSVRHLVGQVWADHVNLELVRQKLGHRDLMSTQIYANQDRSRIKKHTEAIKIL
jgi:integrase